MGKAVIKALGNRIPNQMQAVFIRNMGAVTWGSSLNEAVNNALTLEEDAFRAIQVGSLTGQMYCYMPYELSKKLYFEQPYHRPFTYWLKDGKRPKFLQNQEET